MARKAMKAKEPVRLRFKQLANGNQSVYFDLYKDGKREYFFPKLYLIPETSAEAKKKNANTLAVVAELQATLVLKSQREENGLKMYKNSGTKLVPYAEELLDEAKRYGHLARYNMLKILIRLFKDFAPDVSFRQIDKDMCVRFADYLSQAKSARGGNVLAASTQNRVFAVLHYVMVNACKDGIISVNPMLNVEKCDRPKKAETKREWLTLSELKRFAAINASDIYTRGKSPVANNVKVAFLFSCFTGLRYSDIVSLDWKHFRLNEEIEGKEILQIEKAQEKTDSTVIVPISKNALKLLPPMQSSGKIFEMKSDLYTNKILVRLCKLAKINKHITFHSARHTAATLMLNNGAGIYEVSKILGHSDVSVTQIYLDLMDDTRRKTVERIPTIDL